MQKKDSPKYDYDVALSFASKNRDYVQLVAAYLKQQDIKVFFDEFERTRIWGNDSSIFLDKIFRLKARYCVVFTSIHYKNSRWTRHELKSALSRAFEENEEYILQYRFDNTEITGISTTKSYLENLSYKELCKHIIQKIKNVKIHEEKFYNTSESEQKIYKKYLNQKDSFLWIKGFIKDLDLNPSDPYLNLIYSIHLLKGKDLTSTIISSETIKKIEQYLCYPLTNDNFRGTTLVILALIKHDFYEVRGWITKPSSKDYCQKLLKHKIFPDKELLDHLSLSPNFSFKLKKILTWLK